MLEPCEAISTGTFEGVTRLRALPEATYLRQGDIVEAEVEGLGVLRNAIGVPLRAIADVRS